MADEILKEETNMELIADSDGTSRPSTHFQDEEVLSNTEIEDSNDVKIDKESDSDGEADTDSDKPRVTDTVVTNCDVFEFFKKNKNLDSMTVVKLHNDTFGVDPGDPHNLSTYKKISNVYRTVVNKLRGSKRSEFLKQEFQRAKSKAEFTSEKKKETPRKMKLRAELEQSKKKNRALKRQLDSSFEEIEQLDTELESVTRDYSSKLEKLAQAEHDYGTLITKLLEDRSNTQHKYTKQLTELQAQYEESQTKLREAEKVLKSKKTKNLARTLNRKKLLLAEAEDVVKDQNEAIIRNTLEIKEKTEQLELKTEQLEELSEKVKNKNAALKDKQKEINELKLEKQRLQEQSRYFRTQCDKTNTALKKIKINLKKEKVDLELKENDLKLREKELDYLEAIYNDMIQTFQDGKYTDDVRLCIMELLSMNVSLNKVNEVIKAVLKRLAKKDIDKLPSKSLKSQLLIEARHLADIQVGEAMLKGVYLTSVLGNTLHGDGTTKYHRHYQNFQINTVDNIPLSVGLLEIVDQDAETILASWKDKISDIAKAVCGSTATENDVEKTVNELLCTVKNTMSDHCATNGVFNSLLEEMRKTFYQM